MARGKGGKLSKAKAKEILKDGTVHGKKLTKKQKGYFGAVAGGNSRRMGPARRERRARAA